MNRRDFIQKTIMAAVAASVAAPTVAESVSEAPVIEAAIDRFEVLWEGPSSCGAFMSPDLYNALKFLNELIFSDKKDIERFSEVKLKKNGNTIYHYAGGPFASGHGKWTDDFLYSKQPTPV